ncbi:MAG: TldD/PmbA family protein, partial [Dehalococcoidia bacterium]
MDEQLRQRVADALKGHDARYIEVRIEEAQGTQVRYRGRDLEEMGRSNSVGGCVRALAHGGWGFVCFNRLEDLREKVAAAVRNARLVAGERVELAPIEPVVDAVPPAIKEDPRTIPLPQKKALLDRAVELLWSVPGIASSTVRYGDGSRRVLFANSEGSYIQQERVDVVLFLSATARDGGDVQQSSVSLGSQGDFGLVERSLPQAQEVAQRALELLKAPQVRGGEYTVVLDPVLAGVFIHEAFGHLSEADHVYQDERLQKIMVLGRRFGGRHLNVVDGAAVSGLRGSYRYDDEGMPATQSYLLREGELVGRLHSRETAAKMGEHPTGNARAINYAFPPIVRMTNTFIQPDGTTFPDLIADIQEGVYARNWYGGMTSMEQFTFSAG